MVRYISLLLFIGLAWGQCDEGFIEILDIPENVNVLDSSFCFYQFDLDALEEIISLNALNEETSDNDIDNDNGLFEFIELGEQEMMQINRV